MPAEDEIPIFEIDRSQKCVLVRHSSAAHGYYLHFAIYEEGAPAAVVRKRARAISTAEASAQPDTEFVISQLFLFASENHVIWATHHAALRSSRINSILASFLTIRGVRPENTSFNFQVVLDSDIVQRALDEGIKEIDLGLGDFRPTLERISNGGALPDQGFFTNVASIFRDPATARQLNAAADIEGKLILKPGRNWEKPDVKDLLVSMSTEIRESYEDEFTIVTASGLRLTQHKMSLKKECEVDGNQRILSSTQMEVQMRETFNYLRDARVIE